MFFGLVATVGTRYVHNMSAPPIAWMLGAAMGLMATAILVANNLRDIETDARAGKRTLAVIMGESRTRMFYAQLVPWAFTMALMTVVVQIAPPVVMAVLILVPFAWSPTRDVIHGATGKDLVTVLKTTSRLQMGMALILAVILAIWL